MSSASPECPYVLVIDDDDAIREAVAAFLEDDGFVVMQAANGIEALELLADVRRPPALILLDLMMPGMDGWTFCKLRQGIRMLMDTPVVAMSAARVLETREPLRVDGLLPKPFDPERLTSLATRMMERKSLWDVGALTPGEE